MSTLTTPQLHISFEFAERLVHHLKDASQQLDGEFLLRDADALQAEINAQFSRTPQEH
jgi:hypothetical protein